MTVTITTGMMIPMQLPSHNCVGCLVQAPASNTSTMYVGNRRRQAYRLTAGSEVILPCENTNQIWVKPGGGGGANVVTLVWGRSPYSFTA